MAYTAVRATDVQRMSTATTTAAGTNTQINDENDIACTDAFTAVEPLEGQSGIFCQ